MPLLWVMLALWSAGCASLAPRLEPPRLSVVGVELVRGSLFEQRITARMRVQNPNDRAIAVRGVSYTLEVGGEELGRGLAGSSFTVPALGEAEFDMLVTTNFVSSFGRLLSRVGGGKLENIDYEITGKVFVDKGVLRRIPFSHRGTVDFSRALKPLKSEPRQL